MNYKVIAKTRIELSKRLLALCPEYRPDPEQNTPLPNFEITAMNFTDEGEGINELHGEFTIEITFRGDQNALELEELAGDAFEAITQADNPNMTYSPLPLPEPYEIKNQIGNGFTESRTGDEYQATLGFIISVAEKSEVCL